MNDLQKENQRLNENNQSMQEEMARTWKIADDYKSRIYKAIDYITTEQLYTNYQWGKSQYAKILKDLLNILKGEK